MNPTSDVFQAKILNFPPEVGEVLKTIPECGGILNSKNVRKILQILKISLPELMVQLLPFAALYSVAPISMFKVGAIAAGFTENSQTPSLYFGANLEFLDTSLSLVIHAEQAAIMNAWHNGEIGVSALAVTAEPCGYCRQFLYELSAAVNLLIIVKNSNAYAKGYTQTLLPQLLPKAFGPYDLGIRGGLMNQGNVSNNLQLTNGSKDEVINEALHAANHSYAPYTGGYAGCAFYLESGKIFSGRYAENAAFNPSISPLQVAFAIMNMSSDFQSLGKLKRVVLVESITKTISQLALSKLLLWSINPSIELEYYQAE